MTVSTVVACHPELSGCAELQTVITRADLSIGIPTRKSG